MKIDVGRYNAILGRLLSGAGVLDPAGELSPEISATFVMEAERPEWLFLSNQRLMGATADQGGDAVTFASARLRNPTGSGVLAVVEACVADVLTVNSQLRVRIGVATTDLTGTLPSRSRDSRSPAATAGALILSSGAVAASGTGDIVYETTLTVALPGQLLFTPVVLAPGSHIDVTNITQTGGIQINYAWRERELTKYERS